MGAIEQYIFYIVKAVNNVCFNSHLLGQWSKYSSQSIYQDLSNDKACCASLEETLPSAPLVSWYDQSSQPKDEGVKTEEK